MHGYASPYRDKIPLNGKGVAPVIVPSLGFRHHRVFTEVQLLGVSATMVTLGIVFPVKQRFAAGTLASPRNSA